MEADVAITKIVNSRQVEQLLQTERQYWENTQYSRREYLEVIEIEIFLFKIVKMDLTNSQRKNSPQFLDQSKHKYISIFAFSANTFQSDQIEDGW